MLRVLYVSKLFSGYHSGSDTGGFLPKPSLGWTLCYLFKCQFLISDDPWAAYGGTSPGRVRHHTRVPECVNPIHFAA